MPQKDLSDIRLDDDDFFIDQSVEGHYTHRWFDLKEDEDEITGSPGKRQYRGETMMWAMDDWAGGEEKRTYDPENYDQYRIAFELNPRIRGQITGRPNRRVSLVGTNDVGNRPWMAIGDRTVWLGGDDQIAYVSSWSGAGVPTWTQRSAANTGLSALHASYKIYCMVGTTNHVYYSGWYNDASANGKRVLLRQSQATAGSETVVTATTNKAPFVDLVNYHGNIYGWTGKNLIKHNVVEWNPATPLVSGDTISTAYTSGTDLPVASVYSQDWWAEAKATENSIIMFMSTAGTSEVYEYKKGVGRPIWRPPYGFTIKGSAYQNGVMYFCGHWGGDSNETGWGAMYALPLDSYNPIQLKFIRKVNGNNLQMQSMIPSYGYQVIGIAELRGEIFIYDAETDGLTMLDDLGKSSDAAGNDPDTLSYESTERLNGGITFGKHRYFPVWVHAGSGAGNYQVVYYDDDEPDQRETGMNATDYTGYTGRWESSKWDYGFPMERKTLIGFHLVFNKLTAGQTLDLSYDVTDDTDNSSFTTTTQITSATSGASTGRVFIPISTTATSVKFFQLKYRVKLASTSGVKTPILYSVVAEAAMTRKREEWEIVVRLKDEQSKNRPTDRKVRGPKLRDWIEATVESGSLVLFRDGFRYSEQDAYSTGYTSHNVVIKSAEDIIDEPGEGSMRLLLREGTPAT